MAGKENKSDISRRRFLKQAAISGIALASTAGLMKAAASLSKESTQNIAYVNDDARQEMIMKDKKYVLMTEKEKEDMINMFVNNYKYGV